MLRDDARLGEAWLLAVTDRDDSRDRGRGAPGRRRRLPPAPVHPHRAARPHARRRARGPAALRRHAAARADGQRPGRDLPLGVARRLHARADQRRDRAHLRLPAGELHRQRQADADEHRPPRRPRSASSRRSSTRHDSRRRVRRSSTGSCAPTARSAGCSTAASSSSGPGGRLWMDGAIFDITERREAEEALRRREVEAARTEELRASRARIVEAADAARRKIERDLHDGAQQRLVTLALDVRVARARLAQRPGLRRPVPRPPRRRALSRPPPSCASSPAASTPRC